MNYMASDTGLSPSNREFLARRHKLLIGGKWQDAASGKTFPAYNPANGQKIAEVADGGAEDVDRAVRAARAAFEGGPWARMSPIERGKLVWRLGDLIEANADDLAQLEAVDNGKPVTDARNVDVTFACELLRYMGGWSTKLEGKQIPVSLPGDWHCYSIREPVGVVGQIVPWNFPLLMSVWKIAPALAVGCTIILKPAEQTPLSAIRLGELIQEAGFPDGVFNLITGDGMAGAAIAAHPDVDKVAFTGSTEVGRLIVKAASGNLKKVSLELGGKSPVIVFPDADLDLAIPGTANGIFFNAGQCCTAGSRMLVHKKVFDKVMTGVAAEAEKYRIGPGLDPQSQIGPLVSQEQFDRVTGYLDIGRKEGAMVLTGGERWGNEGYFVKPTVLAHNNPELTVVREEIFGPVLVAMPFDDDDLDRIAKEANATPYGLGASVWTRDLGIAHKMARRIKAGTVWINAHLPNDVALPFGGYKQSGWGREMGAEALELYTEVKAVAAKL